MKLTIVRGVPGSGKTTLAKELAKQGFCHIEADQYFVHKDGTYNFDATKLPKAHRWCQRNASLWLKQGMNVVISNTFTRKWEIEPYYEMAKAYGAEFEIINCHGNYQNVHELSEDQVQKFRDRWEPLTTEDFIHGFSEAGTEDATC